MAASAKSYPHPVLGNEDDLQGKFNPQMSYTLRPYRVDIEYNVDLQNKTLEKLAKSKKAYFALEVECPATFFRQMFTYYSNKGTIEIDAAKLRERVTVSFYLCAATTIDNYRPDGLHADYGDLSFRIEKGDVLADGGSGSFIATKTFDPHRAPVRSFVKIQKGTHKGPMRVDYENEKILIELSPEDWEQYVGAGKSGVGNLHASVVFPVLVDALYALRDRSSDYGSFEWFDRLQTICVEQRIDTDDPLKGAQQILNNPVSRGLTELRSLVDADE